MRLSIAAPYPEGAAMALARWASGNGSLGDLLMPSRQVSRRLAKALHRVGLTNISQRIGRGPAEMAELVEIMPSFELQRLAGKLPFARSMWDGDIEKLKVRFDKKVSERAFGEVEAVVGMPGACAKTFELNESLLRVFHEVDGHPRARNEALHRHYPAEMARRESHTAAEIDRIELEISLADVVMSPSTLVSTQMREHGVHEAKIVQASYGVDLGAFRPLASTHKRNDGPVTLVYVGQMSLRKGVFFLTEAAKNLHVQVRLIGPVVDPALVQHLPENVRYLGTMPHQRVAEELSLADAFIFPTLEDACPLVILEAVGSGLPVISSNAAGSLESLEGQDVVTVEPGSSAQLREAMLHVGHLSEDDRLDRAERLRRRVVDGQGVNDWDTWAGTVTDSIARKASEKLSRLR